MNLTVGRQHYLLFPTLTCHLYAVLGLTPAPPNNPQFVISLVLSGFCRLPTLHTTSKVQGAVSKYRDFITIFLS